jgi:S-adenosylmethionine hydrolase
MPPIIALLTDFGLSDPYVAQIKAVLASRAPSALVLDVSHGVAPFNLIQAGFFLAASAPHFPAGTVFVTVVDPGVGSERRIVLLEAGGQLFLAPDNGLLGLVLERPGERRAFDLTPAAPPGVTTFHGRDVFAPLAAALAHGASPDSLGPEVPVAELVVAAWSRPQLKGRVLLANVLHPDRFGNCILNLALEPWAETLAAWPALRLDHPRPAPLTFCRLYGRIPAKTVGLLPGSQGYLELAMNRASAAAHLGLQSGALVRLTSGGEGGGA